MQSGENAHALQKNLDFIRLSSIIILLIHFYCTCFPAIQKWGLSVQFVDRLLFGLSKGLFFLAGIDAPKTIVLALLAISMLGNKGKKDDKLTLQPTLCYLIAGILLFFLSSLFLHFQMEAALQAILYISSTSMGYLFILFGGARLSRLLYLKLGKDVFNELSETFPQMEQLLTNEYSVNLPTRYNLKGKIRNGFINIINPFRALLVAGTPGSRR
jgi:hypothetical protein